MAPKSNINKEVIYITSSVRYNRMRHNSAKHSTGRGCKSLQGKPGTPQPRHFASVSNLGRGVLK